MTDTIWPQLPDDPETLAAFGAVTLHHEHLNHALRMAIRTFAGLGIEEVLDATAYDGSRQLRERVRGLARKRLGEGQALLKLQALLQRCERATDRRNELVHGIWGVDEDGTAMRRGGDRGGYPLPTAAELDALSDELAGLWRELTKARLEGFIAEALSRCEER